MCNGDVWKLGYVSCLGLEDYLVDTFQTSKQTKDIGALQKGADFIKAYALGFDVNVNYSFSFHRNTYINTSI